MLRALVRKLDALIRRFNGVFEFTPEPDCILRLQKSRLNNPLSLPAETLDAGTEVLLLHLWNERLPKVPSTGPDLAWSKALQRQFLHSLQLVADYLVTRSDMVNVQAVGGTTSLVGGGTGGGKFLIRIGFTLLPAPRPLGKFGEYWEDFYARLLVWTFNPSSLRRKSRLHLSRMDLWITRPDFLRRFQASS